MTNIQKLTSSFTSFILLCWCFNCHGIAIQPAQSILLTTDSVKTVVVSTHYTPPWSYKNCRGAEIDVIRLAFEQVGLNIECSYSSYARLVQNFLEGKSQFASPIVKLDGDNISASYSDNFIPYIDVVASFEPKKITVEDLHKNTFVAYQNADKYLGKTYALATKKARYYKELPGRDEQIHMLARGRVNYVVGEKNILLALAKKLYPNKPLHINLVLKQWDIRAGARDPALMKQFNKGLRLLKAQGKIEQIFDKYNVMLSSDFAANQRHY